MARIVFWVADYRRRKEHAKGKDDQGTEADEIALDAYIQDPLDDDFECHFLGGEYRFGLNVHLSSV